jgi:hypothetical protein
MWEDRALPQMSRLVGGEHERRPRSAPHTPSETRILLPSAHAL